MEQNLPQTITPNDVVMVDATGIVLAQDKAQIDMQISTAKAYPRDVHQCLNDIKTWATMDDETAQSCFYSLSRKSANGGTAAIEGLSVRMAEIILDAWGNARADSRVVANDGKTITAQAVCMDLERNVAIRTEVKQRITDKNGRPFNEDMQVTIANSACSKAFRNAVLKVIPKAITAKAISEIKQVAMGKAVNMTETRTKLIQAYASIGVKESDLLAYLEVGDRDQIDQDMVFHLRGLFTAIKEGDTTIEDAIINPVKDKEAEAKSAKQISAAKADAMNAAAEAFKNENKEPIKQPK